MAEGSRGGEFYTPTSIVRGDHPAVRGRILDPACGSGGMFVSSTRFVETHSEKDPSGQERVTETVRLSKMNLAVYGLSGDVRWSNTYEGGAG